MRKVIKNQKYQTREEVCTAACHSTEAAVKSSIRHWNELATAPIADFCYVIGTSVAECALCERAYRSSVDVRSAECTVCVLYKKLGHRCFKPGDVYSIANAALQIVAKAAYNRRKYAAVKRFRRAADKMIKLLESCLEGCDDKNETVGA